MKLINFFFLIIFFLASNCSDLKKSMGFEKDSPDEFLIKKGNAIRKPPNYDLLPPDKNKLTQQKNQTSINANSTQNIVDEYLDKSNNSTSISQSSLSSEIEKNFLDEIKND